MTPRIALTKKGLPVRLNDRRHSKVRIITVLRDSTRCMAPRLSRSGQKPSKEEFDYFVASRDESDGAGPGGREKT